MIPAEKIEIIVHIQDTLVNLMSDATNQLINMPDIRKFVQMKYYYFDHWPANLHMINCLQVCNTQCKAISDMLLNKYLIDVLEDGNILNTPITKLQNYHIIDKIRNDHVHNIRTTIMKIVEAKLDNMVEQTVQLEPIR